MGQNKTSDEKFLRELSYSAEPGYDDQSLETNPEIKELFDRMRSFADEKTIILTTPTSRDDLTSNPLFEEDVPFYILSPRDIGAKIQEETFFVTSRHFFRRQMDKDFDLDFLTKAQVEDHRSSLRKNNPWYNKFDKGRKRY